MCEQKEMKLKVFFLFFYHHFELFEWLNSYFNFEIVSLSDCLKYNKEPIFYFYIFKGSYVETIDDYGKTPLNNASIKGQLEIIKFLTKNVIQMLKQRIIKEELH